MIDWYFDEPIKMSEISQICVQNERTGWFSDEFIYERYDVLIRFMCEDGIRYVMKKDPDAAYIGFRVEKKDASTEPPESNN